MSPFRLKNKKHDTCAWPPAWQVRHTTKFSPLTQRIMAVNVMALAILVGGLLYLGQYQDRLVAAEMDGLAMQARMSASAVAEGAVVLDHDESNILSPLLTRLMIRRLVESNETRTRLYDMEDILIADSLILFDPTGKLQETRLAPPNSVSWFNVLAMPFFDVIDKVVGRRQYPSYPNNAPDGAQFTIVTDAKVGELVSQVWSLPKGRHLLSVAAPVQRYREVLGVVMLTRTDTKIKAAIREVRHDILKIFGFTLFVTLLLSMYLARTISQPLRLLARAAERVRRGRSKIVGSNSSVSELLGQGAIPDFSERQDEIGDLSVALHEMTLSLSKRVGAIENFAADVAHEIKNPLTSLRSAVETAVLITDPERQKKLMQVIQDDVDRMDRLITDISHASRLDAELARDPVTDVDITAMLQTLTDFYKQEIYTKNTMARVVLDPAMPTGLFISGVESRLVQVVQNLIMNALSFAPPHSEVVVSAKLAGNHTVEFSVEDEGRGIPKGKLEAIFDRFYSERPLSEKFGTHSGLGLSISKQIIDAHHGRLWAENNEDEEGTVVGARFIVQLPVLSEA